MRYDFCGVNIESPFQMVNGLDSDPLVQQMVATHDWYFLPCVNPDGYIYTHTTVSKTPKL